MIPMGRFLQIASIIGGVGIVVLAFQKPKYDPVLLGLVRKLMESDRIHNGVGTKSIAYTGPKQFTIKTKS